MIKVYSGQKGFTILFLFIAGLIFFLSLFFWGISEIIELFRPLLVLCAYLIMAIFTFGFLPASLIKELRPLLATYALWMSVCLEAAVWLVAFFFVVKAFGLIGILAAVLFKFLVPIAVIAAVMKNTMHIAGHLILWSVFAFGMRLYSQWLPKLGAGFTKKGSIIDIEAREI